MSPKILLVDDQRNLRTTLVMMLRGAGYDITEAGDGDSACDLVSAETFDVVLTDLRMGTKGGLDVLRHTKEATPLTEVIVMTAYGTVESAVEAMRVGAYDYIQKPFTEGELLVKVQKAVERRRLTGEVSVLASQFREHYHFENIIGRSEAIRDVLARLVRIAPTDATVLITGESGTGKELIARAVHANSARAQKPYVSVNCAAVSETLLESELFGHARGAFTGAIAARKGLFEEATGGTFFLDEIAETTPAFQAKLLRAIQDGEIRRVGENKAVHVDVRIIAATNQELKQAIAEKRFRQDLYYRLNVARFSLPPLRERIEDIPLLVDYFLDKFTRKMRRGRVTLADGVLETLSAYDYPGNIRELENMIEQGVALAAGGVIQRDDVIQTEMDRRHESPHSGTSLQDIIDRAEREAIEHALREVSGNRERAAEALGLSSTTLWRKMKRLNVVWP